ncbi:hypothetical protein HanRHA438_Chr08g0354341 [Helianthus annuus]|nr:hypothetical protein HanRHA438_Chr08g0354341 [Helianthus annuus]
MDTSSSMKLARMQDGSYKRSFNYIMDEVEKGKYMYSQSSH